MLKQYSKRTYTKMTTRFQCIRYRNRTEIDRNLGPKLQPSYFIHDEFKKTFFQLRKTNYFQPRETQKMVLRCVKGVNLYWELPYVKVGHATPLSKDL